MAAGKAKAGGVPWSCGVTPAGTEVILPGPDAPAHVPPSIPGSSCLHQPSVPVTQRPHLPGGQRHSRFGAVY